MCVIYYRQLRVFISVISKLICIRSVLKEKLLFFFKFKTYFNLFCLSINNMDCSEAVVHIEENCGVLQTDINPAPSKHPCCSSSRWTGVPRKYWTTWLTTVPSWHLPLEEQHAKWKGLFWTLCVLHIYIYSLHRYIHILQHALS